jgi:hypothetical protein
MKDKLLYKILINKRINILDSFLYKFFRLGKGKIKTIDEKLNAIENQWIKKKHE